MPKRIRRPDGLSIPFDPTDAEHLEHFPRNDIDHEEASATYVAASGAQDLANAAHTLYHDRATLSTASLEARLAWLAVATRVHYRITAARYDYLTAAKTDPGLAELCKATDAVPSNEGRGPGWTKFLNAVAVDEVRASAKRAAEVRAGAASRRKRRGGGGKPNPAVAAAGAIRLGGKSDHRPCLPP